MNLVEVRKGVTLSSLDLTARRTGAAGLQAIQTSVTRKISELKSTVNTRYEIEALALGHKATAHNTQTPAPIKPLRAWGSVHFGPKATEIPAGPPMYFPGDLWPKTNLILLEAQRMFPLRSQTVDLCKWVIAEMTTVLSNAVRENKMGANQAITEGLGGMADLLHSMLVHNDDWPHSGFFEPLRASMQAGQGDKEVG